MSRHSSFFLMNLTNHKDSKRSHMSGDAVEKRSILYSTALVNAARIKRVEQEKLDAEGDNAMFCDCDEDMQLEFSVIFLNYQFCVSTFLLTCAFIILDLT